MKKTILVIITIAAAAFAQAQPPAGPAPVGAHYGARVNAKGAVDIAQLPAQLQKENTLQTKVTAKVIDVCPKKGCWLKLQVNDSTTAFVKMKDYGFFLPLDIKGKTVVLDAEATLKTTPVEELKHYAKDAKKSKEEIALITQPKEEISLTAKGILVVADK